MSGGYFGFTPAGTQYSAGAYGAPAAGAYGSASYPAPQPYFTPATAATAYASAYQGATGTQTASQTNAQTGYATRLDSNTFAAPKATSAVKPSNIGGGSYQNMSTGQTTTSNRGGGAGGSGSSYTGYDAAVYAAATSYLQSKASGSSNQWLGLRRSGGGAGATGQTGGSGGGGGGGGRGSFPNKRGGGRPGGGGMQQLHYCEVCKISCAGPQTYREHLEGQRHKKKEVQMKSGSEQSLAKTKVSFRCDLCQVTCTGHDTYNAHVRGAKHQKTLKLHQTLGKPIPNSEPTIIPPTQSANTTIIGGGTILSDAGKKVVGVPKMSFVGGQKLTSTASGPSEIKVLVGGVTTETDPITAAAIAAEQNVQPVGEDYVEPIKDHTGKLVQFFCKLCDCKFNDLNAKDMHLKGRRHRLQFKKKVNPDLEVDMKPGFGPRRRQNEERLRKELMRLRQQELWSMRAMYANQMMPSPLFGSNSGPPQPLFGGPGGGQGQRGESSDDRHVMAKHAEIYPTEEELAAVQKLVINTEKALKGVSDNFAEIEKKKQEEIDGTKNEKVEPTEVETEKSDADDKPPVSMVDERLLKGVMRVGLLAKGLLLRGDMKVQLVVLCSEKPTRTLLKQVFDMLPQLFSTVTDEQYQIGFAPEEAGITIASTQDPRASLMITFTSVLMRDSPNEGDATKMPDPADLLDKQKCLDALADLRHAKWFQARCSNLQSCLIGLRIMRDICQRIPTWSPLSTWALELLVEKVMTSAGMPLSPGDALRRVFEAVASGVLLPNGPGLLDPCEKEVIDAVGTLSAQQREDITSSAQHALRLIAFNQLYKILAIGRLPDKRVERKRPRESAEGGDSAAEGNGKKDKKEDVEMTVLVKTEPTTA